MRILILLMVLVPAFAVAQDVQQTLVTANYTQKSIRFILNDLDSRYPQLQLFAPSDPVLDGTRSIQSNQVTLEEFLEELLDPLAYHFTVYRNYAVIIGPRSRFNQQQTTAYLKRLDEIISREQNRSVLEVGDQALMDPLATVTLTGVIRDDLTQEAVGGVGVMTADSSTLVVSNSRGVFTLTVPAGFESLTLRKVGYETAQFDLRLFSDGQLEFDLPKSLVQLDEITIEATTADDNVNSSLIGVTRLDLKGIQNIPVLFGEIDVEKILLLQPGVSKIAEGASGFNVRGGSVDQNLIMQDDGFLLNSSHALGFISTFNADMIQSVSLYKGNMPAQFGGRLASTLDVTLRNGSFEGFKAKAGISPVSSKINLEFPVFDKKASINFGLRSTYADLLLKLGQSPDVRRSSASFYDGQFRYAHKLNPSNNLELSFYSSQDNFRFSDEFGFDYSTLLAQVTWKSQFNERLFSRFSISASDYESARQELREDLASELTNGVKYLKVKELLTYSLNPQQKLEAGISSIYYQVDPGAIEPTLTSSSVQPRTLEQEQGLESAIFVQTEWEQSPKTTLLLGLRAVAYQYLGPRNLSRYSAGPPYTAANFIDTESFGRGSTIASYYSLEPRFSFRYKLSEESSIKGGYARTAQFINQISNLDAPTPSNVWQLSNPFTEPLRAHNLSLGYFKNLKQNSWVTSVEVYYRSIDDLIDYRDFADINANPFLERELVTGSGRAYGLEMSIKKEQGYFTGWLSYTLSKTERKIAEINEGQWYPSNLDRTHDLSFVGIVKLNERHTFTFNFNWASGRPTTAPLGSYTADNGLVIPIYSDRNQVRIPDFHRLDISYTVGQGYRVDRKVKTSWSFSVYNVYARKNPYSVFFIQKPFDFPSANRFAVLGSIFPSISFNIEWQ